MSEGFQVQAVDNPWKVEEDNTTVGMTSLNPQAAPFIFQPSAADSGLLLPKHHSGGGGLHPGMRGRYGGGVGYGGTGVFLPGSGEAGAAQSLYPSMLSGTMPRPGEGYNHHPSSNFRPPARALPRGKAEVLARIYDHPYRTKMLPPPLKFDEHVCMFIRNDLSESQNNELECEGNQSLSEAFVQEFLQSERDGQRRERLADFETVQWRWFDLITVLLGKQQVVEVCGLRSQCPLLAEAQSRLHLQGDLEDLSMEEKEQLLREWSKDCCEWWEDNFASGGGAASKRRSRNNNNNNNKGNNNSNNNNSNYSSHTNRRKGQANTPPSGGSASTFPAKYTDAFSWDHAGNHNPNHRDRPPYTNNNNNPPHNNNHHPNDRRASRQSPNSNGPAEAPGSGPVFLDEQRTTPFTFQLMGVQHEEEEEDGDLVYALNKEILRELELN